MASTAGIAPPMVAPALKAGDAILFLEASVRKFVLVHSELVAELVGVAQSCCHATLPWFGPKDGIGRRSALYRICPRYMSVRSGRGQHWGGTWTYEVHQPSWVESELSDDAREVLGPARASWSTTPPPMEDGFMLENSAAKPMAEGHGGHSSVGNPDLGPPSVSDLISGNWRSGELKGPRR